MIEIKSLRVGDVIHVRAKVDAVIWDEAPNHITAVIEGPRGPARLSAAASDIVGVDYTVEPGDVVSVDGLRVMVLAVHAITMWTLHEASGRYAQYRTSAITHRHSADERG